MNHHAALACNGFVINSRRADGEIDICIRLQPSLGRHRGLGIDIGRAHRSAILACFSCGIGDFDFNLIRKNRRIFRLHIGIWLSDEGNFHRAIGLGDTLTVSDLLATALRLEPPAPAGPNRPLRLARDGPFDLGGVDRSSRIGRCFGCDCNALFQFWWRGGFA